MKRAARVVLLSVLFAFLAGTAIVMDIRPESSGK